MKKKTVYEVERDEFHSACKTYIYTVEADSEEEACEKIDNGEYIESHCIDEDIYDYHGAEVKEIRIKK